MTTTFHIIGHRGSAGTHPENTLPGFVAAWQAGADAVELDLYLHEGELVVLHDERVDRTTDGHGLLSAFSMAELRRLDAGDGTRIPLLREVLDAAPSGALINLELKGPDTALSAAQETLEWPELTFVTSSFDHAELARFQAAPHRSQTALLFHRWHRVLQKAQRFEPDGVNLNVRIATQARLAKLREAGWPIWVYTVNDARTAEVLRSWGASGVFTDYPARLLQAFGR